MRNYSYKWTNCLRWRLLSAFVAAEDYATQAYGLMEPVKAEEDCIELDGD